MSIAESASPSGPTRRRDLLHCAGAGSFPFNLRPKRLHGAQLGEHKPRGEERYRTREKSGSSRLHPSLASRISVHTPSGNDVRAVTFVLCILHDARSGKRPTCESGGRWREREIRYVVRITNDDA